MSKLTIWGLASGRRTTDGAARGALAWRDYDTPQAAKDAERDWLVILYIVDERGNKWRER